VTAQVRGRGRLQGNVTDKETGKPIAGATVTVTPAGESTAPIVVKTDSRGRWSALGMTAGNWNIDITAKGYETTRGSAAVSEMQMSPNIKTQMAPATVVEEQQPAAAAAVESPLVPKEAADLITEGQELLRIKAGDVVDTKTITDADVKENAKRAVADFEKAVPLLPEDKPEIAEVRTQLMEVMAQAYYRANDLPKAIAMLERLNTVDPWSTPDPRIQQRNLLLVNLYLEHGDLEKGKALIDKLPAGAVTDPTVYINIGILFMNLQKVTDAVTFFNKAIELDATSGPSYYYRGLANLQLKRNAEARADFQKVISLAPTSSEAGDAKQMLDALANAK
jgi:tetratricopeptide (TPR) repeat protein